MKQFASTMVILVLGLAFYGSIGCRGIKHGSQLNDEGRIVMTGLTPAQIVASIGRYYPDDKQFITADLMSDLLTSTFAIHKLPKRQDGETLFLSIDNGTGFFVGADGLFLTNAHVLSKSGEYVIRLNHIEEDGTLSTRALRAKVDVIFTKMTDNIWDVTLARITGFKNQRFLKLTEESVAVGARLLSTGYPNPSSRNGSQSLESRRALYQEAHKYCLDLERDYRQTSQDALIERFGAEYSEVIALELGMCGFLRKNRPIIMQTDLPADVQSIRERGGYDAVDANSPLVVTLGNTYHKGQHLLGAHLDILPGQSGSPILDLKTRRVIGIATGIFWPLDNFDFKEHYLGLFRILSLNKSLVDKWND